MSSGIGDDENISQVERLKREEERRKRREEREKQKQEEADKWEQDRLKREEERRKRREEREKAELKKKEDDKDKSTTESVSVKDKIAQIQKKPDSEAQPKKEDLKLQIKPGTIQEKIEKISPRSATQTEATSPRKPVEPESPRASSQRIETTPVSVTTPAPAPSKQDVKQPSPKPAVDSKGEKNGEAASDDESSSSSSSDESSESESSDDNNQKAESEPKKTQVKTEEKKPKEEKGKAEEAQKQKQEEEKTRKSKEDQEKKERQQREQKQQEAAAKKKEQERVAKEDQERIKKQELQRAEDRKKQEREQQLLEEGTRKRTKQMDELASKKLSTEQLKQLEQSYQQRKQHDKQQTQKQATAFNLFHPEIAPFYTTLQQLSRELGLALPNPEVILIGRKSHGKSSLLESFIGRQFLVGPTSVPLFVHLVYDPSTEFSCSVQSQESSEFTSLKWEEVPSLIKQRSETKGNEKKPIHLRFSSNAFGFNLTVIDTPGLSGQSSDNDVEMMVMNLARPAHRLIVVVEQASVGPDSGAFVDLTNSVAQLDPIFDRTVFVHTKFDKLLETRPNVQQINNLLQKKRIKHAYWVSVPSERKSEGEFQSQLNELYKKDITILEGLQYDKNLESKVGIAAVRKHLLSTTWNSHKDVIPQIFKSLQDDRRRLSLEFQRLTKQEAMLSTRNLRYQANKYISSFLQTLALLLEGSEKIRTPFEGQTLREEKKDQGRFVWKVPSERFNEINSDDMDDELPMGSLKLNGGQQIKRLLVEFQRVLEQISLPKITKDDVIMGAGVNQMGSCTNYVWSACEIVNQYTSQLLKPLLKQLNKRALYIMRRQVDVVESVISSSTFGRKQFPFMASYVSGLYYSFLDTAFTEFTDKYLAEFLHTSTLYWMVNNEKEIRRIEKEDDLTAFAANLFETIKQNIMKKALLLLINHYVFAVLDKTNGLEALELNINALPEARLAELFDVETNTKTLAQQEENIDEQLQKLEQQQLTLNSKLFIFPQIN